MHNPAVFTDPVERLTIYGDTFSGNCLKTKWTADYLGLDYDWVDVDARGGETRGEAFLAINPVGQVPVARWPDGRGLPQSNAIMLYLAESQASPLVPTDPFARAQMMSWLFWEQYSHEPYIAVRRFRKAVLGLPDDQLDPVLLQKGNAALAILNMQLSYTDWLVGNAITSADIALIAYTRVAHQGGFDLEPYPAIAPWIARTEAELGVARV